MLLSTCGQLRHGSRQSLVGRCAPPTLLAGVSPASSRYLYSPPASYRLSVSSKEICSRLHVQYARFASTSASTLPRPRLDYRDVAQNATAKLANAVNRQVKLPANTVESVAQLYSRSNELSRALSDLREKRSKIGDAVKTAKSPAERNAALETAKSLKSNISAMEKEAHVVEESLFSSTVIIPNDTHPLTPIGPESCARLLSQHGPEPILPSPQRDHVRVATALDMLDMESGATVTGSSWYYLRNEGALLELALTNYAMSVAIKAGFTPVMVPDVVKADIAHRCGFQPRDEAVLSQNYHLERRHDEPELLLAGTAEIPLAGMFAQKTFEEKQLPVMVAGLGRAFRAEAGARGADTRGLYRVHQFSKVELFAVTRQDESEAMMDTLVALQTEIFLGLGIPFKVLEMPSEELGASAFRKLDMEAWMPGRGGWGEISSTSNCTDYQSRRLHIVYKPLEKIAHKPLPFAHTLNGTAAAIPRLIVALLENGARLDGNGDVVGLDLPRGLEPFWIGTPGSKIRFI